MVFRHTHTQKLAWFLMMLFSLGSRSRVPKHTNHLIRVYSPSEFGFLKRHCSHFGAKIPINIFLSSMFDGTEVNDDYRVLFLKLYLLHTELATA